MRLVIIGGGNMGGAILVAISKLNIIPSKDILLIEQNVAKRKNLSEKVGCRSQTKIDRAIKNYDVIVLAVKPQASNSVLKILSKLILHEQLVISIMAGISLNSISEKLTHKKIVRAMPNLPTMISEGLTVFFSSGYLLKIEINWVKTIFSSCGTCIEVKKEDAIDAATAISGSGPGYIYYFAEEIISSAMSLGFSETDANILVQKTFLGSILLWQKQGVDPDILREKVSSPGGTTLEALNHFKFKKVGDAIKDGIQKAYLRAKKLSS